MARTARALLIFLIVLVSIHGVLASDLLCVSSAGSEPECHAVMNDAPAVVTPSSHSRQAVWIGDDQSRVVVFSIGPNQRNVRAPVTGNEIRYSVDTRRLPRGARIVEYQLTDVDSGTTWEWTLTGRASSGKILAPDGNYILQVAALHAQPAASPKIAVSGGRAVEAKTLELLPKLLVTGRLVDDQGVSVVNATIADESRSLVALSGSDGSFVLDAAVEELPASLTVQAEGFVPRDLAIPDRRESFNGGEIVLERGQPLSVKVTMKGEHVIPQGTSVAVYRRGRDGSKKLLERQPLPPGESMVTFRRIGTGKHILEVAGPTPLQRRATMVDMPSPPGHQEITITPRILEGRVYFGTEPLSGSTITLFPRHQLWEAQQVLGEEGEFGGTLWDEGVFGATVQGNRLRIPFVTDKDIARDHEDWDIIIPDNVMSGLVVDARTNRGIAGARVIYESVARMRLSSFVLTDSQGRYEITGIPEGNLSVRATATGYLNSRPVTVPIRAGHRTHEQTLALEAGIVVTVQVVDALHQPVAAATILDPILGPLRLVTDARGEVSIPVGNERPRRVWIVPREGSLSSAMIKATDSQPVRIVLPAGTGSVAVTVRRDDETPLPDLRFVVGYNGEIVPDEVWRVVAQVQGFDWITDAAGMARHPRLPPGTYEFWPFVSAAEGKSIARTPGVIAPAARVRLNAGDDQVITVTVRPGRTPATGE